MGKAKQQIKRRMPVSADGVKLRKGMGVFMLYTNSAGVTWGVKAAYIAHTNQRGMVSFESPPKAWHFCWPLSEQVGDHRIFADFGKACSEAAKRKEQGR